MAQPSQQSFTRQSSYGTRQLMLDWLSDQGLLIAISQTRTICIHIGITASQQPIHTHNRALQSLTFSQPNQSQTPWYQMHTSNTTTAVVRSRAPHASETPPARQSNAARKLDQSLVREPGMSKSDFKWGTNICSSTRPERVSVRKAAWWLQMSNLKTLALLHSLRCEIECFQTRCALPGPRIDPPW